MGAGKYAAGTETGADPKPADARERRIIRGRRDMSIPVGRDPDLDLGSNMVVFAGAGSGKTTALVERMIALVRSGVPVEQIVAITFTRRAAGELQERFVNGLDRAETLLRRNAREADVDGSDELSAETDRITRARSSDDRPFIGTIHAFCARILRSRAFEAGLSPDFEQIEDAEEERIRRGYWRRFITEAGRRDDPDLAVLTEAGMSSSDLFDFFGPLAERSDASVVHADPDTEPDLSRVAGEALEYLELLEQRMPSEGEGDAFMSTMEQIRRLVDIRGLDEPADRAAFLERLRDIPRKEEGFRITLKYWSSDPKSDLYAFARELRDGCEDMGPIPLARFIDEQVEPGLRQRRVWLHGCAYRLAARAVEGYRMHRLESGRLTYGDLLREAARLMEEHSDARAYAQRVWPKVLVDEFQDTDPVQARLLFEMLSTGGRDGPWESRRLIPGALFVVGDDKQSIYRFRRADFQVFRTCAESIERQGGRTVNLTANFRSDPALCKWIDRTVGPVFGRDDDRFQAPYRDLEPFLPPFAGEPVVTPVYLEKDGQRTATVLRGEARWIASEIDRLAGTNVDLPGGGTKTLGFGDFLILVRRGKYIPLYVAGLAERGIPAGIGGGDAEDAAHTLRVVHDLLGAVYNPADGVALAAALTGPFMGVSDRELVDYRMDGGTFRDLMADLKDLPGKHEAMERARSILIDARRAFDTLSPYEALVHVVTEHGLLAALAARPDGDLAAGILIRLMTDFRSREAQGWNWGECVEELSKIRAGDLEMNVHSLSTPLSERARVMTMHQAKGLEADVVFLADPKATGGRDPSMHAFLADGGYHLALPVSRKGTYRTEILLEPPDWDRYQQEEMSFERAESRRLVYVACTRARRRLYVSLMAEGDSPPYDDLAPALSGIEHAVGPIAPDDGSGREPPPANGALARRAERVRERVAVVRRKTNSLAAPTWRLLRPSDLEEHDVNREAHAAPDTGYGREYGVAVHHLFESLVSRRKSDISAEAVERDARSVLESEWIGVPPARLVDAAASAGRGLVESDLWTEIAASERVLTEVPFTVSLERDGADHVMSGVVDLAWLGPRGWALVDYKTDRMTPGELLGRYRMQVIAYAEAWRSIFGEQEISAGIWSTEHDRLIRVDGTTGRLPASETVHAITDTKQGEA